MKFNKETLWTLRKEIVLNSMYLNDYNNSFGIKKKCCALYFEGYADYLSELMKEDGHSDDEYFSLLSAYDNADNLWDWELCHIEDGMLVDLGYLAETINKELKDACEKLTSTDEWKHKSKDDRYTDVLDTLMGIFCKFTKEYTTEIDMFQEKTEDGKEWYDDVRTLYLELYAN